MVTHDRHDRHVPTRGGGRWQALAEKCVFAGLDGFVEAPVGSARQGLTRSPPVSQAAEVRAVRERVRGRWRGCVLR